jgi:glycogen(starch) synthase
VTVYVVCTEAPPDVLGGLGRYLERMMRVLAHRSTPVVVFSMARSGSGPRTVTQGAVTLHRIRSLGAGADARPLARIVGVLAFNVVVTARILRTRRAGSAVAVHDWMGCLAGILCRLLGRRPVVFHVHTREAQARSMVAAGIAALETVQARLANLIVVPSQGMRTELVGQGWPGERLRVIPHGFEDDELLRLTGPADRRSDIRRRHLPGGEGWLVVFAGRLAPHKGVLTLIQAVPRLLKEAPALRVVLIGAPSPRTDGGYRLARLIDQLDLGSTVEVTGRFLPTAEVFAHFLAADACAFPSTYEPFGLVAVEAMALGRPVVVGPGYSPEVVGDGAVRCPDDSPDALAEALLRCLSDPAWAAGLGARAAAFARTRTWAATVDVTLAAYAEVSR